jgi:hypothetical protein
VLRFDNADVMQDVERVVGEILHPPLTQPLPSAEGQGENDLLVAQGGMGCDVTNPAPHPPSPLGGGERGDPNGR